jgi:hypothetical protein
MQARMRRCLRIFVPLVIPAALAAQPSPRREGPTAVTIQFVRYADIFGGRLVTAFAAIPSAQYEYRPTPSQQTIGYIAQHLENANYGLCERLSAVKHVRTSKDSLADTTKAHWPKDTLVARLDASLRYCSAAIERLGQLDSPAVVSTLLAFETDLAEHYSQLAVYMRLIGLVPPSALPPKQRVAIEVPAARLSRYVGVYELAPGLELVVALHNDTLTIKSTPGGAEVRLWPESPVEFFVKEVDAQVAFTIDTRGVVTGLTFRQFDRQRPATKLR